MDGAEEYALVLEALRCTTKNSVLWNREAKAEFDRDKALRGLTTHEVWLDLKELARTNPTAVKHRPEQRPYWRERFDYVYETWLEYDLLTRPLYVEMRYIGRDWPQVAIVHSHESSP